MIYTDGIRLVSDESYQELHLFAFDIDLRGNWFQPHIKYPHYNITIKNKLEKAIEKGAKKVSNEDIIRILNKASYLN